MRDGWLLLHIVVVSLAVGGAHLVLGAQPAVQEFAVIMDYPGNRFYPSSLTVKVGQPVRLFVTTLTREHVNRFSIEPWIRQSDVAMPGQVLVAEFTPNRVGTFKIINVGHRFENATALQALVYTLQQDKDVWVREAAARALGELGHRGALRALQVVAGNKQETGLVRERLRPRRFKGSIGDKRSGGSLEMLLPSSLRWRQGGIGPG